MGLSLRKHFSLSLANVDHHGSARMRYMSLLPALTTDSSVRRVASLRASPLKKGKKGKKIIKGQMDFT